MQPVRKRRLVERVTTRTLLAAGYFGLVYSLVSLLIPLIKFLATIVPSLNFLSFHYDPLNFILLTSSSLLFIVSLLAVGIGLERGAIFEESQEEARSRHLEVTQAINHLQSTGEKNEQTLLQEMREIYQTIIARNPSVKIIIGYEECYKEVMKMFRDCKGSEIIRQTSLIKGYYQHVRKEQVTIFNEYLETLAQVVGNAKRNKKTIVQRIVMGFQPDENGVPPPENQEAVLRRRELFEKQNALDRLEMKWLPTNWPLTLVIVGEKHLLIGFPTIRNDPIVRLSIRITNKECVGIIIRWFDDHLWSEAHEVTWKGREKSNELTHENLIGHL